MAGPKVGRVVGVDDMAVGKNGIVAVLVCVASGVIGRLVGVVTVVCGTWHANILVASRNTMLMISRRGGEIIILAGMLSAGQMVQDE
jgi:hypothetical protein